MRLINSSVEILKQDDNIKKMIEIAGRTCYRSEDRITEDSAEEFVNKMIKNEHCAMLEHGTVYLYVENLENKNFKLVNEFFEKYKYNAYSKVSYSVEEFTNNKLQLYITTNLRVLVENNWLDDLKYVCKPHFFHDKRVTVKFICDRGVSHELVRHRVFSFAQESTRFCNYSRDKFGKELTFIIPSQLNKEELIEEFGDIEKLEYHKDIDKFQSSEWNDAANFLQSIAWCESNYLTLLDNGWKPQQARAVLPNALKTEIIVTGFRSDWNSFFKLRCSAAAHPDMKVLADKLRILMCENDAIKP